MKIIKNQTIYLEKLLYTLTITSVFFVMFGLIGPLEIFAGNRGEFEFGFHDFFWMFLGVYFIIWFIASAILALFPKKINMVLNLILFIIGIEFYIQNLFLNKQLIRPDGNPMSWDKLKDYTRLNLIIWVIIAAVLVVIYALTKNNWKKISMSVCICLSSIQIIASISLIVQVPHNRVYEQECKIDATEQFALAEDENIIVFVLDKYANDQFNINIANHPEMKEVLKDFTYYNNANSIFETTDTALSVMLAGQIPESYKDNKEKQWSGDCVRNFYDILHSHGYSTFISTRDSNNVFGKMTVLVGKYDNVKELDVELDYKLMFNLMSKMTIYKYSPYVAKPRFEVMSYSFTDVLHPEGYSNSLYINPEFYQALKDERFYIKKGTKKLFKVQHIQGMHGDYNMNSEAVEIPESEGTVEQSRDGLNVIIDEYLSQIKELGLYDNSTIIIVADHGDLTGEFGLQPLVLIKKKNEEHNTMQVDSSPISHLDFIPTILYYLGEDYSEYGTSIYDWKEGDRRERKVELMDKEVYYYTDDTELEEKARN